jgi:hypothetical protein
MVPVWPRRTKPSVGHRRGRTVNRPNPTGHRIRGGIRPSRIYTSARVCARESCSTRLSQYNRYEHCFTHAPTRFPRVRGVVV